MKEKIKKIGVTIVILLIALLLLLGLYQYMTNKDNLTIDNDAKRYEANIQKPEDWGKGRIAVPGYGDLQMEENTDVLYVALYNPNDNPCYFVFSIIVEGKELYRSGLVPPGEAITSVKLSEKIERGTYKITIRIDTYDLADKKTSMNGSEVTTRIITYSKS